MAQYYSLDEAARALGMSTDEFRRRLATEWKTSPRRYPDGATLRFQVREIDELARMLGQGSDPELKLSDSERRFRPRARRGAERGTEERIARRKTG